MRRRLREHACVLTPKRACAVVAFEADRKDYRPLQKLRVCRSMRYVTTGAALHADTGMFEHERPALIHVAPQTGLLIVKCGHIQRRRILRTPGRSERAV